MGPKRHGEKLHGAKTSWSKNFVRLNRRPHIPYARPVKSGACFQAGNTEQDTDKASRRTIKGDGPVAAEVEVLPYGLSVARHPSHHVCQVIHMRD
jgi:hypothetical protein